MKAIQQAHGENFTIYQGDSCEMIKSIPDESIHFTIFSPPFSSMYTFSDSARDMSNNMKYDDFIDHFKFLIPQMLRITKPGRILAFHCMQTGFGKFRDGFIGLRDFRGDLIRSFVEKDWIYHSEVCIWKNPVVAMQRTKNIGLLYKQLKKDSCICRQGLADYLVLMRKRGDNEERVTKDPDEFPVQMWQNYASPVWMDINPSKTLQHRSAREHKDERHICPLQLEVIERAVELWTNPKDVVFSPFAGIGSEGYVSLQMKRRFIGMELKKSYYEQAVKNLKEAENPTQKQLSITDKDLKNVMDLLMIDEDVLLHGGKQ